MLHRVPVLLAAAAALTLCTDEGEWLPTQVRELDWEALRRRGMQMTRDEFWHPDKGGVLSATVQINGCTASFVSADGLLVTNHHCGFDAVSQLSSVEHNWLRDGFVAASRADELPAPGMQALVLQRIDDVTAAVHAAQDQAKTDLERWDSTQRTIARLVDEAQKREPGTVCSVASFLEGKEYQLYHRIKLTDVRLAYAPPRAVGEFGGDVDNWEWPRHTGDFCFFRVYGAPDGKPRDHQTDNVPWHPAHSLKLCRDGVQPGDLAIVMGYPGLTQRYKSSRAVATRQGYVYPRRDVELTAVIEVLERAAKTGEAKALALAPRIKELANVQKNARGMVYGLRRNAVVAQKLREEEQLRAWLSQDRKRAQEYGSVVDEQLALDDAEASAIERDFAIGFTVGQMLGDVPLLATLVDACAAAAGAPDGAVPPQLQRLLAADALTADFELVQLPVLAVVLGELASLPAAQRLRGTEAFAGHTGVSLATGLLGETRMFDASARRMLAAGGAAAIDSSGDPVVVLARGLAAERLDWQRRARERQGRSLLVGRRWIEAQEAFRGRQFYPDANNTLRVSIATVKGYSPRDGVTCLPQTTVAGLLQKETGAEPFASPKALLAAAAERQKSRWFDARLGDVPVCFLCDADTTGGNSGSPVVNGKGELVGLNFDRVFENVAGDFGWNAERSRNVVCDVRYVLWILDGVLPAPALLRELGV
jgi:hypothetical protein